MMTVESILRIIFCAVPAFVLLSAIFVSYGKSKGLDAGLATLGVSIASLCQVGGRLVVQHHRAPVGRTGAAGRCAVLLGRGLGVAAIRDTSPTVSPAGGILVLASSRSRSRTPVCWAIR